MPAPRSGVTLDTLRMAFDNLRAHRLRSALTVFGVVIGVLVVVVVSSILTGMRRNVIEAVEEYGTNNIFAFHLTTGPQLGPRDRAEFRRKPLRPEDGAAVRELAPAVGDVAHCAFLWLEDRTIVYGREKYGRAQLQAVSANWAEVTNLSLREGRFVAEADDEHRRPVLVIGHNVAQALFGALGRAAGREVRFAGRPFTVIGVLEKRKGGFMGENEDDNAVFMPYRTGRIVAPRASDWLMLVIRARSGAARGRARPGGRRPAPPPRRAREPAVELRPLDSRPDHPAVRRHHRRHRPDRDRDLQRQPPGRRDRGDEHHAGERHRAHAGDRRAQGARRAPRRHRPAVPVRGDRPHPVGRGGRASCSRC